MKRNETIMWEYPETPVIIGGVTYNVLAFWSLPFILLLLMQGSFDNDAVKSGIEFAYHTINFLAAVYIFREYLKDSFINVETNLKVFKEVVWESFLMIILAAIVLFCTCRLFLNEYVAAGADGILPLFEMELFMYSGMLLDYRPILGTLGAILMGPVTISCLYYATVFAPLGNKKPTLAYIIMAFCIAIPRLCNALTYWFWQEELVLYLVQLPVHMLACRAYHKADTVWAPIAVLMMVNAVSSVALLILFTMA